jgi:heat shock protein HslJ
MLMRIVSIATVMLAAACAGRAASDGEQVAPGGSSPEGTAWKLVEVGGHTARTTGGDQPTLHLDPAQNRASGNTGCNGYSGPYELRADSLTFGALVSTRRACVDDGMNRQEGELMRALEANRRWRMAGDTLVLDGARFVHAAR